MNRVIGYSYISNSSQKLRAIEELKSLGIGEGDIVLDIGDKERNELKAIISFLKPGDRIDVFSIKSLSPELYFSILEKNIDILVYDFSGAVARIHTCSTLMFDAEGNDFFIKNPLSYKTLLSQFPSFLEKYKNGRKSYLEFSDAFKDLYFAYESYQIDAEMTLTLLEELCGISTMPMFYAVAKDYEKSLCYEFDLLQYAEECKEILEKPKRCNRTPKEYFEIIEYMSSHPVLTDDEEKKVNIAMKKLGFVAGYDVFHRWHLANKKISFSNKPSPINFSLKQFQEKYGIQRKDRY